MDFPETEPDGRTSFDNIDPANAGYIEVIRSNASSAMGKCRRGNNKSFRLFPISQIPLFHLTAASELLDTKDIHCRPASKYRHR